MKKVQQEIKCMVQLDVIEPADEPTEWCSPIVVVQKADGRVQICVVLTRLNQAVRREVYQMPTGEETLGSLTAGSVSVFLNTLFCRLQPPYWFPQTQDILLMKIAQLTENCFGMLMLPQQVV